MNRSATITTSLFVVAVGAILTYAVDYPNAYVDLDTAGMILMAVGLAGGVIGLIAAAVGDRTSVEQTTTVDDGLTTQVRSERSVASMH